MSSTVPKPTSPIMQALTAAMQSGPARKREDAFYRPRIQDYLTFSNKQWISSAATTTDNAVIPNLSQNPNVIRLISWNIDILEPFCEERMKAALEHLKQLVNLTPPQMPVVVFLQEMGQSDLEQIRDSEWIQNRFNVTDLSNKHWLSSHYGTTTLVDRRLQIRNVFRVPWISKFDRDGLFVDLALSDRSSSSTLRLCNTHLESLVADPPVRPFQLAAAAPYLHEDGVAVALLAGDLNAIQPFDRTLHSENNLKDTYLELGGQEDSHDGYTWGYQVPQVMRDKFGCSRMDKILMTGSVQPINFERIGVGIKVADDVLEYVSKEVDGGWVTDHYGVMGDFELTNSQFNTANESDAKPKLA